jgi:hypothetical protein
MCYMTALNATIPRRGSQCYKVLDKNDNQEVLKDRTRIIYPHCNE